MFGFALLAPLLVRPLARLIGAPLARFQGLTGQLARENAIRQPQRTAVTAVGADDRPRARRARGDLRRGPARDDRPGRSTSRSRPRSIVTHQDGFSPIPARRRRRRSSRSTASPRSRAMRFATGRVVGETGNTTVTGIDPDTVGSTCSSSSGTRATTRTLAGLGDRRRGRRPGLRRQRTTSRSATSCSFTTPRGNEVDLQGRGHVQDPGAALIGDVHRHQRSRSSATGTPRTSRSRWSLATPGADPDELKQRRGRGAGRLPGRQAA